MTLESTTTSTVVPVQYYRYYRQWRNDDVKSKPYKYFRRRRRPQNKSMLACLPVIIDVLVVADCWWASFCTCPSRCLTFFIYDFVLEYLLPVLLVVNTLERGQVPEYDDLPMEVLDTIISYKHSKVYDAFISTCVRRIKFTAILSHHNHHRNPALNALADVRYSLISE